jgi:hypothetical protein
MLMFQMKMIMIYVIKQLMEISKDGVTTQLLNITTNIQNDVETQFHCVD